MHDSQRIKSRSQVIHHDPGAFGQLLQQAERRRLQDIENTKKYKACEKSFPSEWDSDERDQLARNFVDHDELRIFQTGGARDPRGGGDSDERDQRGRCDCCPGTRIGRKARTDKRPDEDGRDRSPSARSGLEAASAEKSCDESGPQRGAGAGRPFGKLRAGSRDSRSLP